MGHIIFLKDHDFHKKGGRAYVDKWLEDKLVKDKIARPSGADLLKERELKEISEKGGAIPSKKKELK